MIPGVWRDLPFWDSDWPALQARLNAETRPILPPAPLRFAALEALAPGDVRVVILGQDPYPTRGHANGLAFSVARDVALPRSLRNIYAEMRDDIGAAPETGDLTHLARQGVLLLNTALSVPEGCAGGHDRLGWSPLVDQVLARVAARPVAFILWGAKAQKRAEPHLRGRHLTIRSPHPSPLSARRGFFGSRPFSRVNSWLDSCGFSSIDWANDKGDAV